ncbi:MAG: cobalamin biosynthesis protein CbiX [Myxococcales bacterium]|jgi:sirohydrochlorin ferrochelatase|nr:MAG: cobalamin biosynthesis protein CbiX [Myxococcales bacterium]
MLGIVIVDHGSRRTEANQAFLTVVERFAERREHDVVEAAHMELAPPTLADAFERAIARGATRIIVHPYFLFAGRHSTEDIPRLCTEAAAHSGVEWRVTEPLGLSDRILDTVAERIEAAIAAGKATG